MHPTPVYETLAMGLVAWLLWQLRDRLRPGLLFALYLVLAGLERFLVEFVRRNDEVVAGLTAPQLESLALMVAGRGVARARPRAPAAPARSSRRLASSSSAPQALGPSPASSQRSVSPWISASCWAERWSPPSSNSSRFGSAASS